VTELRMHVQHVNVCDGCRSLITDGVVTRYNGDDVTESYRALVARRHGWGFDQAMGHLKLCGGIPPWFSYDPCGGCGTNRAGNRHLVATHDDVTLDDPDRWVPVMVVLPEPPRSD